MLIVTAWTKFVTKAQVLASGAITMVNVLIWYYVLEKIIQDIANWKLVVLYALGCSIGTALSTYYFQKKEEKQEALKISRIKQLSIFPRE